MNNCFYDRVAKIFGGYHSNIDILREYPHGDPEQIFLKKLREHASVLKDALDVGCADGRFTLSLCPYFRHITAIDISRGMLAVAGKKKRDERAANVSFRYQNLSTIALRRQYDCIYCRRGPTDYPIFFRLLKPHGYYIEIGIGENDARSLKEAFGRGQNYGKWTPSFLSQTKQRLQSLGFTVLYARNFYYPEYYRSYQDLELFLRGVPIFEDFDSKKDRTNLTQYAASHTYNKSIMLERHRFVVVAQKPV